MSKEVLDTKKGLNNQIKFQKAADKITVNTMSKDEAAALEKEAASDRSQLVGADQKKKKRGKLSKILRPKMSDADFARRRKETKRKKSDRVTKRQTNFKANQPRITAMGKILAPPMTETGAQGTSGTRYSPDGSSADRAFQNIINTLTMRRSSGG